MAASSLPAPGAPGPDQPRPSAMALRTCQCIEGLVSAVHMGETLTPCTRGAGEGAGADRGDAHAQGLHAAVPQGAEVIVRLNPFRRVLSAPPGQPGSFCDAWQRQPMAAIRTLEVVIQSPGGPHAGHGWVHAYQQNPQNARRNNFPGDQISRWLLLLAENLSASNYPGAAYRLSAEPAGRARHPCRQRHKTGTPQAESLGRAGWVLVLTPLAPTGLSAQTRLTLSRCRWPVELAIKRWESV
jgi:hypothetical protein